MVRNMLAVLSALSRPTCPSRTFHFRAVPFPFTSFRSLACARPITNHSIVSRHSPVHNLSDLSLIHKSDAANSIKTRDLRSHFGHSHTPSVSRKEHNFKYNGRTMKTLGFAMSDRRISLIRASQHVSDVHGWTDPMQDAWAEVWTSPVVPPSEPKVAEIPRRVVTQAQPHPHPKDPTLIRDLHTSASSALSQISAPPNQSAFAPRNRARAQLSSLPPAFSPSQTKTGTETETETGTGTETRTRTGTETGTGSLEDSASAEEQRTPEWFAKREGRLTASAFGNAVGLWQSGRSLLWEEKIGLGKAFTGNAATRWGTSQESTALTCYSSLTGNEVHPLSFQVYKPDDPIHDWLGASPDGLLQNDRCGMGVGDGVLEIKCPYNKGYPEEAPVPNRVPAYYMPQAQGLLEILDRDWLDFYIWTPNGSAVFRVERDAKYWTLMYSVLSNFWWSHVIPARDMVREGRLELVNQFKPPEQDVLTNSIKRENTRLVKAAVPIWMEENGVIKDLRF